MVFKGPLVNVDGRLLPGGFRSLQIRTQAATVVVMTVRDYREISLQHIDAHSLRIVDKRAVRTHVEQDALIGKLDEHAQAMLCAEPVRRRRVLKQNGNLHAFLPISRFYTNTPQRPAGYEINGCQRNAD